MQELNVLSANPPTRTLNSHESTPSATSTGCHVCSARADRSPSSAKACILGSELSDSCTETLRGKTNRIQTSYTQLPLLLDFAARPQPRLTPSSKLNRSPGRHCQASAGPKFPFDLILRCNVLPFFPFVRRFIGKMAGEQRCVRCIFGARRGLMSSRVPFWQIFMIGVRYNVDMKRTLCRTRALTAVRSAYACPQMLPRALA